VSRTASVLGEEIEKCSQQASARAPAPIFIFGSGRALARRRAVTIARTPSACVVEGQLAWYRTPGSSSWLVDRRIVSRARAGAGAGLELARDWMKRAVMIARG